MTTPEHKAAEYATKVANGCSPDQLRHICERTMRHFLAGHAAGKQEADRWWAMRWKKYIDLSDEADQLRSYGERTKAMSYEEEMENVVAEFDAKAKEVLSIDTGGEKL